MEIWILGSGRIVVESPMTLGGLGGRIALFWATFKLKGILNPCGVLLRVMFCIFF